MNKTPTTLIIMDGFGLSDEVKGNAVRGANTPVLDRLNGEYAHTRLSASGLDVGLPAGQMGNSEVGHTNIGGGRVVFQDLPRISRAIEDGTFFENPAYNAAMDACLEKGTALHRYGLTERHARALLRLSDGEERLRAAEHIGKQELNVAQAEAYIDRLVAAKQAQPPRRRPTYIIKDVRLFLNSVERGIQLMRGAGVGAQVARQDTDSEICLTVRIPKKAGQGAAGR